jgi:hypothetical protein
MSAYHQMGFDSENLLRDPSLQGFRGAILTPVNYPEERTATQITTCQAIADFETVFDPQLYFPRTERGCLREWSYFPTDVDTADIASDQWWDALTERIVETCLRIQPSAVCSAAVVPRAYSDDYFVSLISSGAMLSRRLAGTAVRPIQTAVVSLNELAIPNRPLAIASILTRTPADRVYLIFIGDREPRRELNDVESLKGAMRLISEMENAGLEVLVGFSSSDIILWKHAGASHCASGKFFNLRRFTPSRFEEPAGGGGQLPYWFEESLLAFLRESDLIRIRRADLLSETSQRNPFGQEILDLLDVAPGTAWLAKSWRQYLWWFSDLESRLDTEPSAALALLRSADQTWRDIDERILMEERTNDGSWVRAWRRACIEFLGD